MLMVSVRGLEGELISIEPAEYAGYVDITMYDVKIRISHNKFAQACTVPESEIKIWNQEDQ